MSFVILEILIGSCRKHNEIQPYQPVYIGENSFTIDGDIFSNQRIVLTKKDSFQYGNYAASGYRIFWNDTTNGTSGWGMNFAIEGPDFLKVDSLAHSRLDFSLEDKGVGTYYSSPNNIVNIYFEDDHSPSFTPYASDSFTVTITKFGPILSLIEGTFSGRFYQMYNDPKKTKPMYITNGKFSVVRIPDQKYIF